MQQQLQLTNIVVKVRCYLVSAPLKQIGAAMENASLPREGRNVTSEDDDLSLYLANIRDLALKVTYILIGTVGIIDNLFVIVVFALFINIKQKVFGDFTLFR